MAGSQFRAASGALIEAAAAQARLANSTMHLFKASYTPPGDVILSSLVANEATFDGYAPATMAAWAAPVLAPVSGWLTFGPLVVFRWVFSVGNVDVIGGYWIQDAGGNLIDVVIYNSPKSMTGVGMSIEETPTEVFPSGPGA
jgi:hypothetical protein